MLVSVMKISVFILIILGLLNSCDKQESSDKDSNTDQLLRESTEASDVNAHPMLQLDPFDSDREFSKAEISLIVDASEVATNDELLTNKYGLTSDDYLVHFTGEVDVARDIYNFSYYNGYWYIPANESHPVATSLISDQEDLVLFGFSPEWYVEVNGLSSSIELLNAFNQLWEVCNGQQLYENTEYSHFTSKYFRLNGSQITFTYIGNSTELEKLLSCSIMRILPSMTNSESSRLNSFADIKVREE